jgi:hypothetical protein
MRCFGAETHDIAMIDTAIIPIDISVTFLIN